MRPISKSANNNEITAYTFFDFTAKLNWNINPENKLSFMIYEGRDRLFTKKKEKQVVLNSYLESFSSDNLSWGNILGSMKWTTILSPEFHSSVTIGVTDFKYSIDSKFRVQSGQEVYSFHENISSGIRDGFALFDATYLATNKFKLRGGIKTTYHYFRPSASTIENYNSGQDKDTSYYNYAKVFNLESYIESEWNITDNILLGAGIRSTSWINEKLHRLDERLFLRYTITDYITLRSAYTRIHQFVHLLTTNSSGVPTDLWMPSNQSVKPASTNQNSVGIDLNLGENKFSIEGYQKSMSGLILNSQGISLFNYTNWYDNIHTGGKGDSKGLELMFERTTQKHNYWIAYTLSKTTRKFDDNNQGKPFLFKYDRRHVLSLTYIFHIRPNTTLSANWYFASGNYITLPKQLYLVS